MTKAKVLEKVLVLPFDMHFVPNGTQNIFHIIEALSGVVAGME